MPYRAMGNGPEGTSKATFDWSERTGVRQRFIAPGKPVQKAVVESFNGKFRPAWQIASRSLAG